MSKETKKTGLALLRQPFEARHIGKLPKPTKSQTDAVKADYSKGIRCSLCGAWHHKDVAHLDYVGHAALTDRLLDCDESWTWKPLAIDQLGLPAFDATGGLWIELTVLGVSRLGYGNAAPSSFKDVGSREKEVIGDALRNAAMRFGAALDLWHKGDLHDKADDSEDRQQKVEKKVAKKVATPTDSAIWAKVKAAYMRDGNFNSALERVEISEANMQLMMRECNNV